MARASNRNCTPLTTLVLRLPYKVHAGDLDHQNSPQLSTYQAYITSGVSPCRLNNRSYYLRNLQHDADRLNMSGTFPLFQALPLELQLKIWSHAALSTEGTHISISHRQWDIEIWNTGHSSCDTLTMRAPSGKAIHFTIFNSTMGALLQTCRLARREVMRGLKRQMEKRLTRSIASQEQAQGFDEGLLRDREFVEKSLGVLGELIHQHNTPTTFPQFPSLPLELQLQIWSYAAQSAKGSLTNVNDKEWNVYIYKTGHSFYDSVTMVAPSGKALHFDIYNSSMGALLQTCGLSRRETLRGLERQLQERLGKTCALQSGARWWYETETLRREREFEERSLDVVGELLEYTIR